MSAARQPSSWLNEAVAAFTVVAVVSPARNAIESRWGDDAGDLAFLLMVAGCYIVWAHRARLASAVRLRRGRP